MRSAAVPVLAWAAWLTVLAAVLYAWTPGDYLQWPLLAGAALATLTLGLVLLLRRRRKGPRLVPDLSLSTVLLALGGATALNGAIFGLWLILIGLGLAVLGVGGVVRELVAARSARARPDNA